MTSPRTTSNEAQGRARRAFALTLALAAAGALGWAVLSLPREASGLTAASLEQLPKSGVTNPVTAAVLNYRGYDTLLEIGVLLLAVLGVWSVAKADAASNPPPASPVLGSFLRLLLPVMLLIAGYLLWIGSFAPGGAFQAGAVLAGGIVLWLLADGGRTALPRSSWLRLLLSLGLAVFIAVAAGVMMIPGGRLLEYPPAYAGTLILLIESAALISIALTLAALFVGGRPPEEPNAEGGARLKERLNER